MRQYFVVKVEFSAVYGMKHGGLESGKRPNDILNLNGTEITIENHIISCLHL